ncbi:acyl carrier protein [Streptomyces monashensis]|uniref:acyl carrier protein n=1 Tax=Streptomyces monashensis TaxID=1678012 RepID=UPI0034065CF1
MSETYDVIRSVLTAVFRVPEDEIHPQATLDQLALDSLALAELVLVLHERFGVKIDKDHAARGTTVAEVVDRIDALRTGAVTS